MCLCVFACVLGGRGVPEVKDMNGLLFRSTGPRSVEHFNGLNLLTWIALTDFLQSAVMTTH